jgi:hypothetical protein
MLEVSKYLQTIILQTILQRQSKKKKKSSMVLAQKTDMKTKGTEYKTIQIHAAIFT